jgi:hypothetical protein
MLRASRVLGLIVLAVIVFVIIAVVNFSNTNFLGGLNFDRAVGCTSNPPTYPGGQSTDCVATDTTASASMTPDRRALTSESTRTH